MPTIRLGCSQSEFQQTLLSILRGVIADTAGSGMGSLIDHVPGSMFPTSATAQFPFSDSFLAVLGSVGNDRSSEYRAYTRSIEIEDIRLVPRESSGLDRVNLIPPQNSAGDSGIESSLIVPRRGDFEVRLLLRVSFAATLQPELGGSAPSLISTPDMVGSTNRPLLGTQRMAIHLRIRPSLRPTHLWHPSIAAPLDQSDRREWSRGPFFLSTGIELAQISPAYATENQGYIQLLSSDETDEDPRGFFLVPNASLSSVSMIIVIQIRSQIESLIREVNRINLAKLFGDFSEFLSSFTSNPSQDGELLVPVNVGFVLRGTPPDGVISIGIQIERLDYFSTPLSELNARTDTVLSGWDRFFHTGHQLPVVSGENFAILIAREWLANQLIRLLPNVFSSVMQSATYELRSMQFLGSFRIASGDDIKQWAKERLDRYREPAPVSTRYDVLTRRLNPEAPEYLEFYQGLIAQLRRYMFGRPLESHFATGVGSAISFRESEFVSWFSDFEDWRAAQSTPRAIDLSTPLDDDSSEVWVLKSLLSLEQSGVTIPLPSERAAARRFLYEHYQQLQSVEVQRRIQRVTEARREQLLSLLVESQALSRLQREQYELHQQALSEIVAVRRVAAGDLPPFSSDSVPEARSVEAAQQYIALVDVGSRDRDFLERYIREERFPRTYFWAPSSVAEVRLAAVRYLLVQHELAAGRNPGRYRGAFDNLPYITISRIQTPPTAYGDAWFEFDLHVNARVPIFNRQVDEVLSVRVQVSTNSRADGRPLVLRVYLDTTDITSSAISASLSLLAGGLGVAHPLAPLISILTGLILPAIWQEERPLHEPMQQLAAMIQSSLSSFGARVSAFQSSRTLGFDFEFPGLIPRLLNVSLFRQIAEEEHATNSLRRDTGTSLVSLLAPVDTLPFLNSFIVQTRGDGLSLSATFPPARQVSAFWSQQQLLPRFGFNVRGYGQPSPGLPLVPMVGCEFSPRKVQFQFAIWPTRFLRLRLYQSTFSVLVRSVENRPQATWVTLEDFRMAHPGLYQGELPAPNGTVFGWRDLGGQFDVSSLWRYAQWIEWQTRRPSQNVAEEVQRHAGSSTLFPVAGILLDQTRVGKSNSNVNPKRLNDIALESSGNLWGSNQGDIDAGRIDTGTNIPPPLSSQELTNARALLSIVAIRVTLVTSFGATQVMITQPFSSVFGLMRASADPQVQRRYAAVCEQVRSIERRVLTESRVSSDATNGLRQMLSAWEGRSTGSTVADALVQQYIREEIESRYLGVRQMVRAEELLHPASVGERRVGPLDVNETVSDLGVFLDGEGLISEEVRSLHSVHAVILGSLLRGGTEGGG